jgi:hypothetical protein
LSSESSEIVRLVDPEKDNWNPLGIWHRIGSESPTYIPIGTAEVLALSEANGTWFVDAADGWHFFLPKNGVPGYPKRGAAGRSAQDHQYPYSEPKLPPKYPPMVLQHPDAACDRT